jgi:hypothetical protein
VHIRVLKFAYAVSDSTEVTLRKCLRNGRLHSDELDNYTGLLYNTQGLIYMYVQSRSITITILMEIGRRSPIILRLKWKPVENASIKHYII